MILIFRKNFCNISSWRSTQTKFAYSAVKFTSQTMPYYGTMEMSLHCCEVAGMASRDSSPRQKSGGGRQRTWFTARTYACVCLNENYTRDQRFGARPFPRKVTNLWTRDTSMEVPVPSSWNFKREPAALFASAEWICDTVRSRFLLYCESFYFNATILVAALSQFILTNRTFHINK